WFRLLLYRNDDNVFGFFICFLFFKGMTGIGVGVPSVGLEIVIRDRLTGYPVLTAFSTVPWRSTVPSR
ncbi:hypothetical protein J4536_23605, partial [Escherichia coli]|nr:hypothetical protein [Escherichia coli]